MVDGPPGPPGSKETTKSSLIEIGEGIFVTFVGSFASIVAFVEMTGPAAFVLGGVMGYAGTAIGGWMVLNALEDSRVTGLDPHDARFKAYVNRSSRRSGVVVLCFCFLIGIGLLVLSLEPLHIIVAVFMMFVGALFAWMCFDGETDANRPSTATQEGKS